MKYKLRDSPGKEFLAGAALLLGLFIYFLYDFTRVYPPLKKYEYSGTINQFTEDLKSISIANPHVAFDVTDTTGTPKNGYAYYITIKIKDVKKDNEYNIAYKEEDNWFSKRKTKLYLNGAFDNHMNSGGYRLEDKGVKRLVQLFDQDFSKLLTPENNTSP